jgi:tetratricopeptide (TPR) repeat protein
VNIVLRNISSYLTAIKFLTLSILLLFLPIISYSSQLTYTIQIGSFNSLAVAHKQFNSIVQRLNENELDNLRIEKIGKFYSVRLGKFDESASAEKFFQTIKPQLSKGIILKAYIKGERIIKLYKVAVDKHRVEEKSLSGTVHEKIKPRFTEKADKEIKTEISAEAHERKGDMYINKKRFFLAIEEYRQAINQGIKSPKLFRKLALLLYSMGFVDEAIVEMEKAVDSEVFSMELGVLYLAKDRLKKAKEQFLAALEINPGYTHAYYYLGELFLRTRDYDMAWLSVKMAKRLGHKGQDVIRKLGALSKEPAVNPWDESGEAFYIRQILVDSYEKAEDIINRISEGELFEDIAFNESMGPNATIGGFMGDFSTSDLNPKIAEALLEMEILADPVIVETKQGFHIVQSIVPLNFEFWKKLLADSDKVSMKNK